ncbi:hypothetical protein Ga0123462_0692 [Mariprofundus ferrinatatus]|uniref:Uncharacterized protein n=1 Tax=Mariprofundus ferrinatatus TaxID=1921087 RepID=A0A2K8L388_9PROT|nr:hypothetical protein Ga0123462_0692 [Mariprofundus ferrinatatus]
MANQQKSTWKPGKRDMLFLGVVAAVVLVLVLGSGERKTNPVPNDEVHQGASTMAECMGCHGNEGVRPQPKGHIQGGQCFQCHLQPEGWRGAAR